MLHEDNHNVTTAGMLYSILVVQGPLKVLIQHTYINYIVFLQWTKLFL